MAQAMANNTPARPLIQNLSTCARRAFSDELLAIAHNIEMALISSGAEPGKDYTRLDLFRMAEPYMLSLWNDAEKRIEYLYPADEVLD